MTEKRNMTIQTWVQTLVLIAAIFWHYATMRRDLDLLEWRVRQTENQLTKIINENEKLIAPIRSRSGANP